LGPLQLLNTSSVTQNQLNEGLLSQFETEEINKIRMFSSSGSGRPLGAKQEKISDVDSGARRRLTSEAHQLRSKALRRHQPAVRRPC